MKIPNKIKVSGQVYKITISDSLAVRGKDTLGTTNVYLNNQIWLDSRQSPTQLESTFIHEILEIIIALNKLDINEQGICILETNLYQVLKDNKLLK